MKSRNRKNKDRKTPALGADAERRYGAIADAARSAKLEAGWDRAMKRASTGDQPKDRVKLHPGWDAAFRRARGA